MLVMSMPVQLFVHYPPRTVNNGVIFIRYYLEIPQIFQRVNSLPQKKLINISKVLYGK